MSNGLRELNSSRILNDRISRSHTEEFLDYDVSHFLRSVSVPSSSLISVEMKSGRFSTGESSLNAKPNFRIRVVPPDMKNWTTTA
jgi:hypothetical protein